MYMYTKLLVTHIILVKSVVGWQVLVVSPDSQMPLSHHTSAVSSLLEVLRYGGLVVG